MLLLMEHPHFDLHAIGASSRSAGKKYGDVAPWKQTKELPEIYGKFVVKPCEPEEFKDCDIVFSGLDSSVAGEIEMAFLGGASAFPQPLNRGQGRAARPVA